MPNQVGLGQIKYSQEGILQAVVLLKRNLFIIVGLQQYNDIFCKCIMFSLFIGKSRAQHFSLMGYIFLECWVILWFI